MIETFAFSFTLNKSDYIKSLRSLNTRSPKWFLSCLITSFETFVLSTNVHKTPTISRLGLSWFCFTISTVF